MRRSTSLATVLVTLAALGGCAGETYYPTAAAPERNTIIGRAEIEQSGHLASCAHDAATLLPVTRLTAARMERLYGGANYAPVNAAIHVERDPAIDRMARHAACDTHGYFRFSGVPDGRYYVIAGVRGAERGSLKREVDISGGVTRHVLLGG